MRILLVNPNMTTAMTDTMAGIARTVAGARAEIIPITATRGFPYIASRAEAQIAGAIALEMIAEYRDTVDAVIIAAFGDPSLAGARELFDMPVVGMAEAAMHSAAMLGERFSIVTFSPLMTAWYMNCIAESGLGAKCTGVRTPPPRPVLVDSVLKDTRAELIALARSAATEDRADVIILGGAPLAGLAAEIANEVPAIVIDPIAAATAQAIALASITMPSSFAARAAKPASKSSVGLSRHLEATIAADRA
ncbi:aspartate/glutamate racemase family protein [Pseudoruegeria sp. SK021]|uniref:aspartate/glutamate racemase family protein n=1 Tax=Pseudoruegeria sp. SK021 TaxID=1933035 RepID=UPI000A23D74B|nr:aspartate/glutamate racemase family protein [Pseudoruegeria sp. SK021]OSP54576.1 hydrogenase expression protein HupH [Pseudoruegeria sp. SK021]